MESKKEITLGEDVLGTVCSMLFGALIFIMTGGVYF